MEYCYECAFFGYSPLGASVCYKNPKEIMRLWSPYHETCKEFAIMGNQQNK